MSAGLVAVAALLLSAVALEVRARRDDRRATAAQAVSAAMRTMPGRTTVLLVWVWLGVHFLAR